MRKTKSAILEAVHDTAKGLHQAGVIDQVTLREFADPTQAGPYGGFRSERSGSDSTNNIGRNSNVALTSYYLSRDRVLSFFGSQAIPTHVLGALQGLDVSMSSAILSSAVGSYLLNAIASGGVKTLQQLAFEEALRAGSTFIYNGHFYGKGFAYSNKKPSLTLTEKLDEPLAGKKLVFEFSKNGLVNQLFYPRQKPGIQRYGRSLRQDLQAGLRPCP